MHTYVLTDTEDIEEDTCYLNHSQQGTMSAGSLDMAWTTKSELEAEGMAARAAEKGKHYYVNIIY